MFQCSFCHDYPESGYCAICGCDVRQSPLFVAICAADKADRAFDQAVKAAGYKSRWDFSVIPQQCQALRDAYFAKVDADALVHREFEHSRGR